MLLILLTIVTVIGAFLVLYGTINAKIKFTIAGGVIALVSSLLLIFVSFITRGG